MQKLSILFVVLFISLFQQAEKKVDTTVQNNLQIRSEIINIDSIRTLIKEHGWNNSLLESYSKYLVSSELLPNKEKTLIESLPGNFQKTYLYSLILKKQGNFRTMYDSLSSVINFTPNNFRFYDELVFSANANNYSSFLNDIISKNKSIPLIYYNYVLGLINSGKGEYETAAEYFQKSVNRDTSKVLPLYQLSYALRNLGNYKKALEVINSAIRHADNNAWLLAKVYPAKGSLFFLSGEYQEALDIYTSAYEISLAIHDRQDESKSLINLGIMDDIQGKSREARKKFKESISIAESINDPETEASALSELGVSYTYTNNLIEAKNNYVKSYSLFKAINNKLRLSLLSGNIGKIYMAVFDYNSALKYYNEGLEYSGENKRAQVLNLTGLGDVNANLSNYARAIKFYKQAQNIASQIDEVSLSADVQLGLGALSFNLNRYYSALKHFKNADSLGYNLGNPYLTADTYYKLGLTYFSLDSLLSAEDYFEKAVGLAAESGDYYTEASALNDYAVFYLKNNDIKQALGLLDSENKISSDNGFKYLIGEENIIRGEIFNRQNNTSRAEDCFIKANEIGMELNEFNLQIEANFKLAGLFENSGNGEEAEKYYKSAIDLIESVSYPLFEEEQVQISYFASKYEIYDSYIQFLLKKKRYIDAFNVIDKSRSRNTSQNLNNLKLESILKDRNELNKIYEYEWMIHSGIYGKDQTDSIKTVYSAFKNLLTAKQPGLKRYLNMRKSYTLNEIREKLNENENLISIYTTAKNTTVFLINRNGFKYYVLDITKQQISEYISEVSPYFNDSSKIVKLYYNHDLFAFNLKAAFELYSRLLRPVLKDVPLNDKIIFSPSTELLSFPFEFLITAFNKNQSSYDYSNNHYLIFDYDISYTSSAGMYIDQEENKLQNNNKVLIAGDPVINTRVPGFAERRGLLDDSPGIPRNIALLPLKYSEEEIDRIGSIINADKILVKSNATETNFKENAAFSKLIHLSTHSILHNKQPVIFFSNFNDKANDGFLEASEVAQLKLNSDLIVLSTCNSGLGLIDESEGVLGMAKAFFEAGAKSVIVSLWEVNDKYTSKFMELFYENLSKGLDKSEALRQAKIGFIKNYSSNPYYWGAFVLNGNTSTMNLKAGINTVPYLMVILLIIFSSALSIIIRNRKIQKYF